MALLAWIKSRGVFFKLQEGDGGGNLSDEDVEAGFVDYISWSILKPVCLDIDDELPMKCVDGGMLMDKKPLTVQETLPACFQQAFQQPLNPSDVVVLLDDSNVSDS